MIQAFVDDLATALDQSIGIQQQARTRLDMGAGLRVRRPALDTEWTAGAVDEVAGVPGADQQWRWMPGSAPAQLAGHQIEDHYYRGRSQRSGNARGHPVQVL